MAKKFRNKYRIESHRMPFWNYAGNGIYYITFVTQNRELILGNISEGRIILSDFGKIVDEQWHLSFQIRNELFLDEYVIMPNHLHAIVVLKKMMETQSQSQSQSQSHVETHGRASLHIVNDINPTNPVVRKPKSLSSFMAGFKSVVNTKIDDYIDLHHLNIPKYNRNNHFFQPNYYDHIIRNSYAYKRIKKYIINNPIKWEQDRFNNNDK